MRPLPLLGLLAGLAMLGWGGYSLYARFSGPEVYWGKDRPAYLADLENTVGKMQSLYNDEQEEMLELRKRHAALPAGEKNEELEKKLSDLTTDMSLHDKVIKEHEFLLKVTIDERDGAKGRSLRRGILFTLLGLVWTARAGSAAFAVPRRRPAIAEPGPSPLSPRPAD